MSTIVANQWNNPDGTENYKVRAWVNFNGTGTVAIRESGNVSSITDNGTGDYTVNFETAMPDANYSISFCNLRDSNNANQQVTAPRVIAAESLRIAVKDTGNTLQDCLVITASIFR